MPALLRRFSASLCLSFCAVLIPAQSLHPAGLDTRSAKAQLVHVPLAFEPNVGQASQGTDYLVRSTGMVAELNATRVRVALPTNKSGDGQKLSIDLLGASATAVPSTSEELPGQSNYLIGANDLWHTHVKQYGRVTYRDVYDGIDLTYYGDGSHLEHDFIVQPGAATSRIRLQFTGAEALDVTPDGDLHISLHQQVLVLRQATAYQQINGQRRQVPARFALSHGTVTFDLGAYDKTQPLIIDPVLDYSTFLGDASVYVTGMSVDAAGDTYVTGAAPVAFPANASTPACSRCVTGTKLAVYVTKLNSSGTAILYSTFLGGSVTGANGPSNDQSSALAVDTAGNAIVTGWTSSADFPLKNAIPSGVASYEDGFLTSLTPDGSALNFSSRLGGSSSVSYAANVYTQAVATDTQNNVYVTGTSGSPYLPTTPGALNAFTPSYTQAGGFLLKLSPAGALQFGAIVGKIGQASGSTGPAALAVDETGVIYMAGTTGPNDYISAPTVSPWPVTAGAYQSQLLANSLAAPFVTRISADGSTVLSSTLVGSGSVTSISLTPTHDVLLTGVANYNFPVTSDAYAKNVSTSINNVTTLGAPGFFAKVSQDGTQLLYSSAFGLSGASVTMSGIAQDPSGNVWLAGTTTGALPLVNPLQTSFNYSTSGTGFVSKFDPAMHNLLFSTYVNSSFGFSQVHALAVDSNGLAHVAGIASQDFPTTAQAPVAAVTAPPANYTYTYGFAAVIDSVSPGPSICTSSASSAVAQVGQSANGSYVVTNCGDGPLTIQSVQLTSDLFTLSPSANCTGTIAAGASCTVAYTFTPKSAGAATATVVLSTNAPMAANSHVLTATGTIPVVFLFSGSNITFTPSILGGAAQRATVVISNRGTALLSVDAPRTTISGPFSIVSNTCAGASIKPPTGNSYDSCTYIVSFSPTTVGAGAGTLTLFTNDPVTPTVAVSLAASVAAAYPTPTVTGLNSPTISLDGGPVSVTLLGANFYPATQVLVNGINVPVQSQSNTALSFTVDPATLGSLGEFPVQAVNPAPGGTSGTIKLTTYRSLALTSTNVVYDPNSKLLFAAIPALSATNPNTILPIDPTTGTFGTPIPVGNNPTRMALSADGHYLYVGFYYTYSNTGQIQRIDLTTKAVDRTFALPGSSDGVIDLHVVPGSPQLVVASLARASSPSENGVALFNDSGLVQTIPNDYAHNYYSLDNFAFTNDGTFYGYPFVSNFFNSATVQNSGIVPLSSSVDGTCCNQSSGSIVVSDGTLLYTNSGQVWDPKAQKLLGTYDASLFYEAAIVADATAKRTFMLSDTYPLPSGYTGTTVLSYDPSTIALSGSISFSSASSPMALTRWGIDGFGFLAGNTESGSLTDPYTDSKLILFRSSLATAGVVAPPVITGLLPSNLPAGSPASTITLTGTGFAQDAVALWNGTQRTTTYVSSTSLQLQVTAADLQVAGVAQLTVKNVAAAQLSETYPFQVVGNPITFTPSALSFAAQAIATASSPQMVSVKNTSGTALTGLTFGFTGTDASLFTKDSNCTASLAADASCTVSVAFTPNTVGSKTAALTVSQGSTVLEQSLSLTGSGVSDFTLGSSQTTPTSTVTAGQPATFAFTLATGSGFQGTIALSCGTLPQYATCSFSPSSVTDSANPTAVTLTVSTQQTVTASLQNNERIFRRSFYPISLGALFSFGLWGLLAGRTRRLTGSIRLFSLLVIASAVLLAASGCTGGGGSSNGGTTGTGSGGGTTTSTKTTASGTYPIQVTATSGASSQSMTVTLIVQ